MSASCPVTGTIISSTASPNMATKSELYQVAARVTASLAVASSLLPLAGFLFLTVNSGLAAYRARQDPCTLAFVVSAYANLLLLLCCLRAYESVPAPDVQRRERVKLAVWILSSTLNLSFSYRVSKIVPLALSVAVWSIAGVVAAAGLYVFFFHGGAQTRRDGDGTDKETLRFLAQAAPPPCAGAGSFEPLLRIRGGGGTQVTQRPGGSNYDSK